MLTSATALTTLSARRSSWAGRTVISTPCLTTKSNNPVIIKKIKGMAGLPFVWNDASRNRKK